MLETDRFQVQAGWFYLTHVQPNEELLAEAIELAHQGAAVDFDGAGHDLAKWLRCYLIAGGRPLMRDSRSVVTESFLEESDRMLVLEGRKRDGGG